MVDKKRIQQLEKYAKEKGYKINNEATERMRNALSDQNINIRVPSELKKELVTIAKKKKIPYQRYIKSILIEAISKER